MANTPSSKKRVRQEQSRYTFNTISKNKYKIALKALKKAVADNQPKEEIQTILSKVYQQLDFLGKKRIFHPNKSSRKKSRITAMVNNHLAAK